MAEGSLYPQLQMQVDDPESDPEEYADNEMANPCLIGVGINEIVSGGTSFDDIVHICPEPPNIKPMEGVQDRNCIFMIAPFKYDPLNYGREPIPINPPNRYRDQWDANHVRMPCSPFNTTRKRESRWAFIRQSLISLQKMCDHHMATTVDLLGTIRNCVQRHYEMNSLERLINEHYSNDERTHFMSTVLSNICALAINVDTICSRSPPLLRKGSNQSVTMSQRQVASLLACQFFCLFPYRSDRKDVHKFGKFPKINFHRLYRSGHPKKIEKLKCILHYFRRITEQMPNGVITIQRHSLQKNLLPRWDRSTTGLCDLHMTTGEKIEDINCVLQVDFANKCIGGGVLGSGCVQEEIRFSICPEMLVSLLICEMMEPNECVFLIGCERYSLYDGYADSFKFAGDYVDTTSKDNWGRKWCHLVAIDAIYFRDPSKQYDMSCVDRELLKAYTGFRPFGNGPNYEFGVATGSWGCGAFHGDKYLKAIIQLMAASEATRPLIYAAYWDKTLVNAFKVLYDQLKLQKPTVGDLYKYIQGYLTQVNRGTLFEYILEKSTSSPES